MEKKVIGLSEPLIKLVEAYQKKRFYATLGQAANELIRIGLSQEGILYE